jgi:predicted NBD/HSP70 family sugar kinase
MTTHTPACLDAGFISPERSFRNYESGLSTLQKGMVPDRIYIALERENGQITRSDMDILPPSPANTEHTLRLLERHLKFGIWARGAHRVHIAGPAAITARLKAMYSSTGLRHFDVETMTRIYGTPFLISEGNAADIPTETYHPIKIGGHTKGCRIGFDLGASDYKLAAVIDGKAVYTEEIPWDPKVQTDPQYHVTHITTGLKKAAAHLPRVDAVGGSSAGIIVNNEIRAASLFRAIPEDRFKKTVIPLFKNLATEWNVPFQVANDGDVTALAGAMALGKSGILGIALGSSEAAGFIDKSGHITGWINELAFAPVDINPTAPSDEWSGDLGVGGLYFSQQVMPRLTAWAGLQTPADLPLPELLKYVQSHADAEDPRAIRIFETVGFYLAQTIPWYKRHYDFESMLILGRVTSGRGGDVLMKTAKAVLKTEYPEIASQISVNLPDEKTRRLGQSVAAASLPAL